MEINEQNLILLKQKEDKFFGLKKGFEFLDSFLDHCEKLKQKKSINSVEVIDYRNNQSKYFDANEIQCEYNNFYLEFLYEKYFFGFYSYEKLRGCISEIIKQFNLDSNEIIITKIIVRGVFKCFYLSNDNELSKVYFIDSFIKILNIFLSNSAATELSNLVLEFLKENELLCEYDNKIKLSDEYLFWHLKFMSLNVTKIYSDNKFDIDYGCVYGFNNLIDVTLNFLNSRNSNIFKQLNSKIINQSEKDFIYYIYNNYIDLDAYAQELKSFDQESKDLFKLIFFDKIIINSYYFHIIANLCFKKYYLSNLPNILLDKNPNLRLNF